MKTTRATILVLLTCLPSLAVAKQAANVIPPSTLAMMDLTSAPEDAELAATAADALNEELIATKAFTIVERRKIAHVIREQALGQSGMISEESAVKVGQLVGARLLVTGRLSHFGDKYRLDARILDSESAKIVGATYAEFSDRGSLGLAARQVALGLAGLSQGKPATAGKDAGKAVDAPPLDVPVDAGKLRDAVAEIVRNIGTRFVPVTGKLSGVDEGGFVTFNRGTQFVFAGMRLNVYGIDDMTGGKAKKGYVLIKRVDGTDVSGPSESEGSPIAAGDEVSSQPFHATVSGPKGAADAMSKGLESLSNFTMEDGAAGTPVKVEVSLKGTTIGSRHLTVRILDGQDTAEGTFESNIAL